MNRTERQELAVTKWMKNNGIGTLQFATGVGKTYTAILAIKRLLKIAVGERSVHVVVPTLYLQDQWLTELAKNDLKDVKVFVINTYIKRNRNCDLLIIDEAHRVCSDLRSKIFKFNYNWLLCLTATPIRKDGKHDVLLKACPIIDTIDIQEAADNSYVSDFVVYNIGIELSEQDREYYKYLNKEFYKHFAVFGRDFKLAMNCMSNKEIRRSYSVQSGFDEKKLGYHATMFNKYMRLRKGFLYNHQSKLELAKDILNKFKKRTVTFSENIESVEGLCKLIPYSVPYTSKMSERERYTALTLFNSGSAVCLHTSKMLDEGADIPDLDMAIVTSSRSTELVDTQRRGRIIRFKEGKIAVMINIYLKNTRDEEWLRERQKSAINVYWINDIEEIKFGRPDNRGFEFID